jgi:dihydropyrimidinase
MRTLIKAGSVVSTAGARRSDVLFVDEKVVQVGFDLGAADRIVDAAGCLVLPGLIDHHTHLAMPTGGTMTCDDFDTGTAAAAAGGTTCIVDFALQTDGSLKRGLETWHEKAESHAHIDYGFHMAITDASDSALAEMRDLVAEGVSTFKVFMAYKGAFMVDDFQILRVMRSAAENGAMVLAHAENGDAIELLVREALAAGHVDPAWHGRTRPPDVEAEATSRVIRLAQWSECPLFIVHVSCAQALREIQQARDHGQRVQAEACVHHLLLTEREMARAEFEGARYVCSPPLRTAADQEALWAGLRHGALEACSTDHCAFTLSQKDAGRGDFSSIPNGLPSIEHRLNLLYGYGVRSGRLTLGQLVDLTSTTPARRFGLAPRKGEVRPGADADLVIFDPQRTVTISAKCHHTASDYDPFDGWTCAGSPRMVLSRGEVVVDDGRVLSTPGRGRYMSRVGAL